MTVRELCKVLLNPKEIIILINGRNYDLIAKGCNFTDVLLLDMFGDYIVEDVLAIKENSFAIDVKLKPVKATK